MERKYLPIGSVCTLKGKNKKMMITGYYSVEFNGNIKISDYSGCVYPEGDLLCEQKANFNHDDIEKVDFLGYKNEEYFRFQRLFDKSVGNDVNEEDDARNFHKENDMVLASSKSYSKLLFDENGVVMIAESVKNTTDEVKKTTDSNIKFDKDGYVISVSDEDVSNPFKKVYNERVQKTVEPEEWKIFENTEYSENEENSNGLDSNLSKIEFDENGVVVAVNSDSLKNNKYTFDENGVLIAVADETDVDSGSEEQDLEDSVIRENYLNDDNLFFEKE